MGRVIPVQGSGQVASGPQVLGFLGFQVFLGVARKLVKVSEIVEMPWEIAWEVLGSLRKCSGASGRVRNISELSQQFFESVTGRNKFRGYKWSSKGTDGVLRVQMEFRGHMTSKACIVSNNE